MEDSITQKTKTINIGNKESFIYNGFLFAVTAFVLTILIFLFTLFQAPIGFVENSTISFSKGQYVSGLVHELKNKKYIHSEVLFKLFLRLYGSDTDVKYGTYYFAKKISVAGMAHKFAVSDISNTSIKVTVPEGNTVQKTAQIINQKIPNISIDNFATEAKGKEGFLFPDTYFFESDITEKKIVEKMTDNYNKKINPVLSKYNLTTKEEKNLITLASLLEALGNKSIIKSDVV